MSDQDFVYAKVRRSWKCPSCGTHLTSVDGGNTLRAVKKVPKVKNTEDTKGFLTKFLESCWRWINTFMNAVGWITTIAGVSYLVYLNYFSHLN